MSEERKRRTRIFVQRRATVGRPSFYTSSASRTLPRDIRLAQTQPASQPNSFTLQTSEAPGSCQIIDKGHNSSRCSGDASVYHDDRLNRPDIMSAFKKSDSISKAPKKGAKLKTTSSHPPWIDMIMSASSCAVSNVDVARWSPHVGHRLSLVSSLGRISMSTSSAAVVAGWEGSGLESFDMPFFFRRRDISGGNFLRAGPAITTSTLDKLMLRKPSGDPWGTRQASRFYKEGDKEAECRKG
ncbi:hypothetical protein B0H14DRAFT_2636188 [Mycena olivaceomarginata]|nr:hypothetical protein B0H14DRAFT_2636188 [Mycena olivaceomarginata]